MSSLPKTILVPIDFSDPSRHALDYAVGLAESLGAKVYVLHAYEMPIVGLPDGVFVATSDMVCRIVEAANKALADACGRYKGRQVVISAVLKQGDPREVIVDMAKEAQADLVVLGTHGRRGIARALMGSVTESIIRISPVPVLTVHGAPAGPNARLA